MQQSSYFLALSLDEIIKKVLLLNGDNINFSPSFPHNYLLYTGGFVGQMGRGCIFLYFTPLDRETTKFVVTLIPESQKNSTILVFGSSRAYVKTALNNVKGKNKKQKLPYSDQ